MAETVDETPKIDVFIPNIDKLAKILKKSITLKELQFFYNDENREFGNRLYILRLSVNSVKFADYLQSDECRKIAEKK